LRASWVQGERAGQVEHGGAGVPGAGMISSEIACAVYRIGAAEPYPDDYDETVARNVAEQQADDRPPIANPLPVVDGYDVVLLGRGLWNVPGARIGQGIAVRGEQVAQAGPQVLA
jgi:hypothetical protein